MSLITQLSWKSYSTLEYITAKLQSVSVGSVDDRAKWPRYEQWSHRSMATPYTSIFNYSPVRTCRCTRPLDEDLKEASPSHLVLLPNSTWVQGLSLCCLSTVDLLSPSQGPSTATYPDGCQPAEAAGLVRRRHPPAPSALGVCDARERPLCLSVPACTTALISPKPLAIVPSIGQHEDFPPPHQHRPTLGSISPARPEL